MGEEEVKGDYCVSDLGNGVENGAKIAKKEQVLVCGCSITLQIFCSRVCF